MSRKDSLESKVVPLLITESLIGVVVEELTRWLPMRFSENYVPKMKAAEAQAMTLNYGRVYGHPLTPELAAYIVYITNGIPGRIVELLNPKMGKPMLDSIDAVDRALQYEVHEGTIKHDWDEYLALAMDAVNAAAVVADVNMRRITYFCVKTKARGMRPTRSRTLWA